MSPIAAPWRPSVAKACGSRAGSRRSTGGSMPARADSRSTASSSHGAWTRRAPFSHSARSIGGGGASHATAAAAPTVTSAPRVPATTQPTKAATATIAERNATVRARLVRRWRRTRRGTTRT